LLKEQEFGFGDLFGFGLGSAAALEAQRLWKRSGLGSAAALEAQRLWKRSGFVRVRAKG
jgi:hypothetical protein